MELLLSLLDRANYMKLWKRILRGSIDVPEVQDEIAKLKAPQEVVEKTIMKLAKYLYDNRKPVIYPLELKIVPRYPLSKRPLLPWQGLQSLEPTSPEVVTIKEVASQIGTAINAGFILEHFVLVDIDAKIVELRKYADVETRRGYHILFYVKDYPAMVFKNGNDYGSKIVIKCNNISIELMSGRRFLGSYPPQSRYLDTSNGKLNVRRYKVLSNRLFYAVSSTDLEPISATPDEVIDYVRNLLRILGCDKEAKELVLKGLEEEPEPTLISTSPGNPPGKETYSTTAIGSLELEDFLSILNKKKRLLPVCVRQAFLGRIEHGYRFYHLRLVTRILPRYVVVREDTIRRFLEDWAKRTDSTSSDLRRAYYNMRYFMGKTKLGDETIYTVPTTGVPEESFSAFEELGYCNVCPLRYKCSGKSPKQRTKIIEEYMDTFIGDES